MGLHADFEVVTGEALDWAMEAHGLEAPALRERLLKLYRELPAYPEVPAVLSALEAGGRTLAVLSNGTSDMLDAALGSAGIRARFAAVLSVEAVARYKPVRAVYDLVGGTFGARPENVLFVSANGWDASGAAAYGFETVWINRQGLPVDRLPGQPTHVGKDLRAVAEIAA
jgi:2-haloacid dehalogenase